MAHRIPKIARALSQAAAQKLTAPFRRFAGSRDGTIAAFYAVSALAVIGFVALAVDGARAHILRAQLHYAVDSAAIAIGKEMKLLTDAELLALAERYVEANVSPALLGLTGGFGPGDLTVTVSNGDTDSRKRISATAKLRTVMLGMVDGDAIVNIQRSAMVQREIKGLEMAFALDVTGSMEWSSGTPGMNRIQALKAAATDLLDIIFADNATHPKVWISVVPFTRSVQAQTNINWVQSGTMEPPMPHERHNEDFDWNPEPDFAGGDSFCYGARSSQSLAEGVQPPNSYGNKFPAWYQYDYKYRGYWHNKYRYYVSVSSGYLCPDVGHEILPLTNVRANIQNHINALVPYGGTATDRGAVWGWRTISQAWRGYWNISDAARPLDRDAPLNTKVMVLMTDGENSYPYSSDPALTRICNNAKADGVTVVTVMFAMPDSLAPLYRGCASQPELFFPAATGDQLRNTFQAIALQLSVLRLVE